MADAVDALYLASLLAHRPPPAASSRCIYCIIPTPHDQFFVLVQVAPLYRLSLLIGVGIGVCVSV